MSLHPAGNSFSASHLPCPFHCQALIGCFQASPCHNPPPSHRTTDIPSSSHPGCPLSKPPATYLPTSLLHSPYNPLPVPHSAYKPLPVSPFLSNPLPFPVSYPPSNPTPVPYSPSNSLSLPNSPFNPLSGPNNPHPRPAPGQLSLPGPWGLEAPRPGQLSTSHCSAWTLNTAD